MMEWNNAIQSVTLVSGIWLNAASVIVSSELMVCSVSVPLHLGSVFESFAASGTRNLVWLHAFYRHFLRGRSSQCVGLMRFFLAHNFDTPTLRRSFILINLCDFKKRQQYPFFSYVSSAWLELKRMRCLAMFILCCA